MATICLPYDGLYSRFMIYAFNPTIIWKNRDFSEELQKMTDEYFSDYSSYLCDKFKSTKIQQFTFTSEQGIRFNKKFQYLTEYNCNLYGDEIGGLVFRHGTMAFKIAMVLGALGSDEERIVCLDNDLEIALKIAETHLKHSIFIYNKVKGTKNQYNEKETNLLNWIDEHPEFKRGEFCVYAKSLGIGDRTVSDILKRFVQKNVLEKIKQGFYRKT
ncbi:YfjI family protein [Crocinitomicaceae bacterium]|nr:YfjI family protein [Crocinitomicaceae bacterium]